MDGNQYFRFLKILPKLLGNKSMALQTPSERPINDTNRDFWNKVTCDYLVLACVNVNTEEII